MTSLTTTIVPTFEGSRRYLERAQRSIPRGISSHGRARRCPLVFARSAGPLLWDVDGNEYVDVVMGLGPILFGHNEPSVVAAATQQLGRLDLMAGQCELEAQVAERVCAWVPAAEQVLFSCSGSEAVHAAVRIARATTGRRLIVRFEGHYHGWIDPMFTNSHGLPSGDTGAARFELRPAGGGQAVGEADVAVTRFGDADAFDELMGQWGGQVAAVVLEPIPFNFGAFVPSREYLDHVCAVTRARGGLVIFDEVVSGFRVARGGAQELLGVTPDLAVVAKALGSGLPISAVVGSRAAMRSAIDGDVRHSGTYNASPVSLAAAAATLDLIEATDAHAALERSGAQLQQGLAEVAAARGLPLRINRVGSVLQLFWAARGDLQSVASCRTSDAGTLARVLEGMASHGAYVAPRGLLLLGVRHTPDHVERIVSAFASACDDLSAQQEQAGA